MSVSNNKPLKATSPENSQVPDSGMELNSYAESLGLARITNPSDQYRIDRVSLENLLARIIDRYQRNDLSEQQRNELFKLLPTLVERAISNSHAEQFQPGTTNVDLDPLLDFGKREEIARLERLKNQYFQNAREYVKIGNYQYALVEVRRMYIVDPENPVARQYEKWIEQLAKLQSQQLQEPAPVVASEQIVEAEIVSVPESDEDEESDEAILEQVVPEVKPAPLPVATRRPVKTSRISLLSLVLLLLVVVGGGFYVYHLTAGKKTITAPAYLRSVLPPPDQQQSNDLGTPDLLSPTTPTPVAKVTEKEPVNSGYERHAATTQMLSAGKSRRFLESETFSPTPVEQDDGRFATTMTSTSGVTTSPPPASAPAASNLATETASSTSQTSQPFVAIEKAPQVLKLAKPYYPEVAMRAGIEGEVIVKTKIDPLGRPEVAVILKSTSTLFDNAAIEAVMNSEFSPGYMSTGPVTTWIVVPLKFKLNQ